jgi:FtsZ-binding cell division protein ZapB
MNKTIVADLTITMLADEVAELREQNRSLIDTIADLAVENFQLRLVAEYRLKHNPDLLDTLVSAAKYGAKRAA